jgi:hypothetical protein
MSATPATVLELGHERAANGSSNGVDHSPVETAKQRLEARLDELCEKIRRGLNVVVRSEMTLAAKNAYEELHPESRQGGAPGQAGGGKTKNATVAGFAKFISKKTRLSIRAVQLDAQIALGLSDEVRNRLRESEIQSETTTLAYLAQNPDSQADMLTLLERDGAKALRADIKKRKGPAKPKLKAVPVMLPKEFLLMVGSTFNTEYGGRWLQVTISSVTSGQASGRVEIVK